MLALMLFTSRFHVDVVNATYERSRWALFVSMSLLVLHYVLQYAVFVPRVMMSEQSSTYSSIRPLPSS